MPERTCAADGCDQPITDGRSDKRYHADECKWRAQRSRRREARYREKVAARARRKAASAHTCIICDHQFQAIRSNARHCSDECVGFANALARTNGRLQSDLTWRCCKECGRWASRGTDEDYCSVECRSEGVKSPLRRAIETGDQPVILREILARTETTDAGCRVWTGPESGGYAEFRFKSDGKRRSLLVHRLVARAVHGPLHKQPVHHTCANRLCVKPDHLQPTTHRENIAEMIQRNWYIQRIDELEQALAEVAPHHPAVDGRATA